MPYTIITVGFDSKKECFPTEAIDKFLKDKKIISAKEGFFEHNGKNYRTVFIEYEAIPYSLSIKCEEKNNFNYTIEKVVNDQDEAMHKQFKAIFRLTRREEDVLSYLITGKPNKGIAQSLSIAVRTVKTHITNIYKKLGVANKIQMVNVLKNFNLF